MLNYIRAELYKVLRRKYVYITLGIFLLLESLMVAGYAFHNSHSYPTPFGGAIIIVLEFGAIGSCMCLLTGDMVFATQYKNSTLKNEVSFGLSRARVYLGKLIAMALMSVAFMVVMLGYFLGLCAVILPHEGAVGFYSTADALIIVGYFLGACLPLWLGGQAVACMCLFLVHNEIGSSFLYVGIYMVLDTFVELAGLLVRGNLGSLLLKIHEYMPGTMMNTAKSVVGDWGFMGVAWIVGLFWVAASTAVGIWGFKRKEIK